MRFKILGAIDILCTDKTGTLTQDEIILEYPLDIHANLDLGVLKIGYLNSYFPNRIEKFIRPCDYYTYRKESVDMKIYENFQLAIKKLMNYHLILNVVV